MAVDPMPRLALNGVAEAKKLRKRMEVEVSSRKFGTGGRSSELHRSGVSQVDYVSSLWGGGYEYGSAQKNLESWHGSFFLHEAKPMKLQFCCSFQFLPPTQCKCTQARTRYAVSIRNTVPSNDEYSIHFSALALIRDGWQGCAIRRLAARPAEDAGHEALFPLSSLPLQRQQLALSLRGERLVGRGW